MLYGRIDHSTQLIVAPNIYKRSSIAGYPNNDTNGYIASNGVKTTISRSRRSSEIILPNDISLPRSTTTGNVNVLQRKESLAKVNRLDKMARLLKDLKRENALIYEFRTIIGKWENTSQISDVFVMKSNIPPFFDLNLVYSLKTNEDSEYYVKVKLVGEGDHPQNIHKVIEVNASLMKIIKIKELEKVTLRPKQVVSNFVEKIELFAHKKTHYKEIENSFKRFIADKTSSGPIILNQHEVIRLDDELFISVGLVPEHFRYCIIDAQFLKESKIYAADIVRKVDDVLDSEMKTESVLSTNERIKLPKFDEIVLQLIAELKSNLCLDNTNSVLQQNNLLIAGIICTAF